MILLNNVFFNTIEYDIIDKNDKYNIKIHDTNDNIWYGSNMKLTYDIKHNKHIYTILKNFDITNLKLNIYDIIENKIKNLFILFHTNEIFLKKNIHIFNESNVIVLISNDNIDYVLNWLIDKNIYMPDVIYISSNEYNYNMVHISKKIVYLLKIIYNFNFSKICIFNTNIYYKIETISENMYDECIIITDDIENINTTKTNKAIYLKMKNMNNMKNKNIYRELFNVNFYI